MATNINNNVCAIPTSPIPIVFPSTIILGLVDVTNVSIILDVFLLLLHSILDMHRNILHKIIQ